MNLPFTARIITGAGRGKGLGTPTLNLELTDLPAEMEEGVYAGWVECRMENAEWRMENIPHSTFHIRKYAAALHYGPRPVFHDTLSCEVHLLDTQIASPPSSITVTLVERLRDVQDFPSPEELKRQIVEDIERCRVVLKG